MVMIVGEFDYGNVLPPTGKDASFESKVFYYGETHVFFMFFMIIMSILFMNLLVR